jgi:hypothetical protein
MMEENKNNDEIITSWTNRLGLNDSTKDIIKGCNEINFYKLSNNNVLPINYYLNIKGNRILLIKHYDQLKANKYQLNLNNFCPKA